MLEGLAYEDSESPAIGVVPAGVSWEEVPDHIKIAHHPLLVPLADGGQYAGGLLGRHAAGRCRGSRL